MVETPKITAMIFKTSFVLNVAQIHSLEVLALIDKQSDTSLVTLICKVIYRQLYVSLPITTLHTPKKFPKRLTRWNENLQIIVTTQLSNFTFNANDILFRFLDQP